MHEVQTAKFISYISTDLWYARLVSWSKVGHHWATTKYEGNSIKFYTDSFTPNLTILRGESRRNYKSKIFFEIRTTLMYLIFVVCNVDKEQFCLAKWLCFILETVTWYGSDFYSFNATKIVWWHEHYRCLLHTTVSSIFMDVILSVCARLFRTK